MSKQNILIEIAFATRQLQKIITLAVDSECTIKQAISKSGINQFFPEYDLTQLPIGIFGKRIFEIANYRLKSGDRIEIYRPLIKSPNQTRLERAKNQ